MACVRIGIDPAFLGTRQRNRKGMDSQYSTAAIDELMSVVRQVQKKTQRNTGNPVFIVAHFIFGGLASVAFVAVILCRLAGHQIGDELTDTYVFSLVTSVLLFAVGTLMIEQLKGDLFGGFLGRALAGCGLFVMSTQCYEFMQKTRACEVQHELLARQKANPVSDVATFVALRSMTCKNGAVIEWECDDVGRTRPVSVARGRSSASRDRIQSSLTDADGQSRGTAEMPRGASGGTTSTNGNGRTF